MPEFKKPGQLHARPVRHKTLIMNKKTTLNQKETTI